MQRSRVRRIHLLIFSGCVTLALFGVAGLSYRRPITVDVVLRDLWALKVDRGQLQFLHGTKAALRYDPDGQKSQTVDVGWRERDPRYDDLMNMLPPPDPRTWQVEMESWPRSNARAHLVSGGTLPIATTSADGTVTVVYEIFGHMMIARAVSIWMFAGPAALLSLILAYRVWRSRHAAGHCRSCGYDLRASPERCPECGADRQTTNAAVHVG